MPQLRPLATLALALAALVAPLRAEITVTDLLDRTVTLPEPADRIVLGEGRHLTVLALLHDDPVALVAGWRLDKALDAPTLAAYRARFPAIDAIAPVGSGNRDISVESVIALEPDLLVLSLMDQGDPGMDRAREQVEAAGIPVIYVDFFAHPQENSIPSLRILGALTGATERADAFADFYDTHLARITERLADPAIIRPRVFIHTHASAQGCCATVGSGVFHGFVTTAGGQNVAEGVVPGVLGNVSLEYLIGADPDLYLATGGTHLAGRGGLVLGPGVDAQTAGASFEALLATPGLSALPAIEEGRAAGIWHLFNDTPAHIALIEYLAKTFHPDLFADLDPEGTLAQIEARFLPVSVPGTWWVRAGR